jgi:hypothetical protein
MLFLIHAINGGEGSTGGPDPTVTGAADKDVRASTNRHVPGVNRPPVLLLDMPNVGLIECAVILIDLKIINAAYFMPAAIK